MSGSTRRGTTRTTGAALLLMVGATACSSDDGDADASTTVATAASVATSAAPAPVSSTAATTPAKATVATLPTTTQPATTGPSTSAPVDTPTFALLEALASDTLEGRNNATSGSGLAQQLLIAELSRFARPWRPEGGDTEGYLQAFDVGANVIGVVPGSDLADEYVMIGAHYDHLARGDCRLVTSSDDICNGAVDNATGVAATMTIAEAVAADGPRRSVIVAFWDAEEDGLLGSTAFVASPVVPLDRIVTYINFDMQGSNLLPSLANHTVAVGAETGGAALTDLVAEVTGGSTLDYSTLSLVMGQGRSDHAPLAAARVPVVFFTDSTNGCYHSADDEMAAVDTGKLAAQITTVTELVRRLANDDLAIEFTDDAPTTSFSDARQLLDLGSAGVSELTAIDATTANDALGVVAELDAVVAAGPDAYDGAAQGTVLGAAARLVEMLTNLDCSRVTV